MQEAFQQRKATRPALPQSSHDDAPPPRRSLRRQVLNSRDEIAKAFQGLDTTLDNLIADNDFADLPPTLRNVMEAHSEIAHGLMRLEVALQDLQR